MKLKYDSIIEQSGERGTLSFKMTFLHQRHQHGEVGGVKVGEREKKDIYMENITSTFAQRDGIGDELFGAVYKGLGCV